MKLTTQNISRSAADLKAAIGNEKTMPILAHILIETSDDHIILTASDLQTELKITEPATIKTPGAICINAFHLAMFTKNAGEFPLTIECSQNNATLKAKGKIRINTLPADDYPRMPTDTDDITVQFTLEAEQLSNAINQVGHCAGRNDVRYYLNGIFIQNHGTQITLTASDGHRLGTTRFTANQQKGEEQHCIIPIQSALLISKLFKTGTITLQYSNSQIRINNNRTVLTSKSIDAKFPDFTKPLNIDRPLQSEINSEHFINCIETASITTQDLFKGISITLGDNLLSAKSTNKNGEESSDTAECTHDVDPYTLGFNAKYLIESAKHITGMMYINSNGENSFTLQPRDRSVTYLIMPARL